MTATGNVTPVPGSSPLRLQVTGEHTYYEEGTLTATATVTDPSSSQTGTATLTPTITDAALTGGALTFTATANESTGSITVGKFTDDNTGAGNYDFNSANPSADYTATINWGDGTTGPGTAQSVQGGEFNVQASHTYSGGGTYNVKSTVTDDGGQSTTFTSTAQVDSVWTLNGELGQRTNDPERAFLLPIGEATVDLNQGALRISQPLDFDQSPGTSVGGNPALVYNSATVDVRPTIQLTFQTDPQAPVPTQVQAQLTWNGQQEPAQTFPTTGVSAGEDITMSVQVPNAVTSSGEYNWSATVTATMPDHSTHQASTSGTGFVVSRDSSPFGAGWWIDGIPVLVIGGTDVLMVSGQGDSRRFTGPGPNFTSPAEDFGTLVQNQDGSYTYTTKDQWKENFNSQGFLTSVVDPHGLTTTYTWNQQNQLTQVQSIDGGITTLTYGNNSGALLSQITEPGNRTVGLADTGTALTTITAEDNTTRTLGYDGSNHVTSDSWAPLNAGFGYDATTGLLNNVNLGLGSSYTIVSAPAEGDTTLYNGPAFATVTDGLSHTTSYELDERGRLLEEVKPDGATDSYERDQAGQVTEYMDPLGYATDYTYSYGSGEGDLVQVGYADGSFDAYQYDPTFHHVTQLSNALGVLETDTYNATGDLMSSADAYGNTTRYTWLAGLMQTMSDPRGDTSGYVYDADRRLYVAYDALGTPTFDFYDASGNPAETMDAYSRKTFTVYNGRNELTQTTDPNQGQTAVSYLADGQVAGEVNAAGFGESTGYDQRGWVVSSTDFAGATTTDQYDAAGNLTQQTDPDNNTTAWTYDADNREASVTDALLNRTVMQYDLNGDLTSTTDAMNRTTRDSYDEMGRVFIAQDALGRTDETFYDIGGDVGDSIDPRGYATVTWHDLDGRAVGEVDPRGDVSRTYYDAAGNVAETVDGAGQPSSVYHDADNREVGTLDADGYITQTVYNRVGDVLGTADERGMWTQYQYDLLDRQVGILDPDNNLSQTVYDAAGNVYQQTDGNGYTVTALYDVDGRPVWQQDGAGKWSSLVYDPAGNVVASTDNNQQTTYTVYDKDNRDVLDIDPNFHFHVTGYDADGEAWVQVDGNTNATYDGYDQDGENVGQMNADGATTLDGYDGSGDLSQVTDPDNNTTVYYTDGAGNTVITVDPAGGVTWSTYDQDNRISSSTDRLGRQKTFAYDNDGRLLTETWYNADGTLNDTRQYSYDPAGNLLSASNGFGAYQYTYDNAGQALTQTDPFNLTLTMGYDHDAQVTSVQDSLGGTVASQYDGDGRLTSRQLTAGPAPVRLDIGYTPDGQTASLTRYKDLAGTQKVGYTALTYDYAGNLLEVQHQNGTGGVLDDFQYTYDKGDRLISENDSGTVTNYGYDYANQLTSAGGKSYGWDANGNRNTSGYTTGTQNEMLSDGTWNYTYDAAGNVLTKTNIAGGDVWTYGYDLANHLTSGVHRDSHGTLLVQVTEKYDVFGNRVEEDVYTPGSGTAVQRFARDLQGNVWADLDGNNALQTHRLYADVNGQTVPFARVSAAGVVAWYLTDHLGSVRDVTDNTGTVIDHIDYDAFGNITNETQPANGDRYKWASSQWSAALSQYDDDARWYDPAACRWGQQDPLGLGPDSNPYRYAGNGPTDAVDPSGLDYVNFTPSRDGQQIAVTFVRTHWYKSNESARFIGFMPNNLGVVTYGRYKVALKTIIDTVEAGDAPDNWGTWFAENNLPQAGRNGLIALGQDAQSYASLTARDLDGTYLLKLREAQQKAVQLAKQLRDFYAAAAFNVGGSRFTFNMKVGKWQTSGRFANAEETAQLDQLAARRRNFGAPRVGPHGEMPSPRGGAESHHGVMSRWMEENFTNYDPSKAPAVLMDAESHNATRGAYNTWRAEMRRGMGGTFDWSKVTKADMRALSDRMFDAARVPRSVRAEYYAQFENYLSTLTPK
jgi:RHS repeat-associated protein